MLGYSYRGKNTLDTNQKLNECRENCVVSEILRCINGYLVDSNGFYLQDKVHGEFPCDLSSFSVITIRRILSNVGQKLNMAR